MYLSQEPFLKIEFGQSSVSCGVLPHYFSWVGWGEICHQDTSTWSRMDASNTKQRTLAMLPQNPCSKVFIFPHLSTAYKQVACHCTSCEKGNLIQLTLNVQTFTPSTTVTKVFKQGQACLCPRRYYSKPPLLQAYCSLDIQKKEGVCIWHTSQLFDKQVVLLHTVRAPTRFNKAKCFWYSRFSSMIIPVHQFLPTRKSTRHWIEKKQVPL